MDAECPQNDRILENAVVALVSASSSSLLPTDSAKEAEGEYSAEDSEGEK